MAPISRLDITTINLNRLLSRLDERLPPLTHSAYSIPPFKSQKGTGISETENDRIPNAIERRKIAANLEYARKLLLQLETEYAAVKDGRVRNKVAEDVGRWKGWIRRLNERCQFLEEMEREEGDMGESESENKEKLEHGESGVLRNRLNQPLSSSNPTAMATSTALSEKKTELLGVKSVSKTNSKDLDTSLSAESAKQENLTNDLLQMARLLKESSMAFGKQLEDEKPHLELAAQSLDKTAQGMEATGGRMDVMKRDNRVGWYKQLVYLVTITGLMLLCLIMLLLPKLRR